MLFWLSALNSKTDKITEHSSSLIDNIFSYCSNLAQRSHIIYDDISDHLPTLLITDLNEYNNQAAAMQPLTTRDFCAKNYDAFSHRLKETTWNHQPTQVTTANDININYANFAIKLTEIVNKSFPYKDKPKIKSKNMCKKPWLTPSLIKSCRKKSRLQKKYILNPSTINRIKYTSYRNKLKIILKTADKNIIKIFYLKIQKIFIICGKF